MSDAAPDYLREIRRRRAALAATAAELETAGVEPAAMLANEARFAAEVAAQLGETGTARLFAIWRDLRIATLALAASLPEDESALAVLDRHIALDRTMLDGTGKRRA